MIFRLTQDEYDKLRGACSERGSHTLSDFARSELMARLNPVPPGEDVQGRLSEMHTELYEIRVTLEQMTRLLEIISGRNPQ